MSIRDWDSMDWLAASISTLLLVFAIFLVHMLVTAEKARPDDTATKRRIAPGVVRVFDPEFGVVCYVRDVGISCLKVNSVPAEKP